MSSIPNNHDVERGGAVAVGYPVSMDDVTVASSVITQEPPTTVEKDPPLPPPIHLINNSRRRRWKLASVVVIVTFALAILAVGITLLLKESGAILQDKTAASSLAGSNGDSDFENNATNSSTGEGCGYAGITMEEVALHNTCDDCWVALFDRVYNLTEYAKSNHPGGGDVIYQLAGTDGTEEYKEVHGRGLLWMVQKATVGSLARNCTDEGCTCGCGHGGGGGKFDHHHMEAATPAVAPTGTAMVTIMGKAAAMAVEVDMVEVDMVEVDMVASVGEIRES